MKTNTNDRGLEWQVGVWESKRRLSLAATAW
jgi:hypothetical protein